MLGLILKFFFETLKVQSMLLFPNKASVLAVQDFAGEDRFL
jgi:hypothetical protein